MTSGSATASSRWFVRPRSADHAARVFCFPFSGTGASAFSAWPTAIGDVEVCPVQFPGRENRLAEAHFGTYEALAEDLAEALEQRLDEPYAFFGHCSGVLPAFETAVRLAERGLPGPACFFVSGQPAPHDEARDRMLTLGESELRAELEAFVRDRGVEPRKDMIDVGLDVLLRDQAAARAYRRAAPARLECPIVVLHWRDDPEVSLDQLQGWRQYSDSVDFRVVDGGHYDFMKAPEALLGLLTGRQPFDSL